MRVFATFACLALLVISPAHLAAEPGYFRVVDVASDDSLNVRAAPSASSADIGDLAFNAQGIEVLRQDSTGKWGQIIWEDGNGWIAMRFLAPETMQPIAGTALPAGLVCTGTEPFWSVRFSTNSAVYFDPFSDTSSGYSVNSAQVAQGYSRFPVWIRFSGSDGGGSAIIRPGACSDDMSDRTYPWIVDLILSGGGAGDFRSGCCQLQLDAGFH